MESDLTKGYRGGGWCPSKVGVLEWFLEAIASGRILADEAHPNPSRYGHQRILVVEIGGYACVVPYVWNGNQRFLKTIYRSRVYQKKYLPGRE